MRGKRRGPGKYMLITLLILWIVGIICSGEPGPGDGDIIRYPFPHPDLTIYTEEQPPFNYLNEQGQVSGQATLIVREIMRRLDIDCPIVIGGWSSGYNTVIQTGNTALFSTIMTHEREPVFRWVGPIGELQYSVYVRSDNPVTVSSYAALRDRGKIAVVRNDAREEYLRGLGLSSILPLNDDADCIRALSSGEAEFWFGTRDITAQKAKKQDTGIHGFRILDLPPISQNVYIAFNRRTPDAVIHLWQQALDSMKEDGTYDLIQSRYMPYICSWVRCTP